MSKTSETFFTAIGCMDGRVQDAVAKFGRKKFGALFADTLTEAGLVGQLAKETIDKKLLKSINFKMMDVSVGKHNSKGIVVHGHQECAGNPVSDEKHIDDIKEACELITLLAKDTPVVGVFVYRDKNTWEVREV